MDKNDAAARIKKMMDIIYDEAHDNARKIREQTKGNCHIQKAKIANQGKNKVEITYQNNLKNYILQKHIEKSTKLNASRLSKMAARQDVAMKVKEDAKQQLKKKLGNKDQYKEILKKQIIQGLIKMMEKEVQIRCKEADLNLVEAVLSDATKDFSALIKKGMWS